MLRFLAPLLFLPLGLRVRFQTFLSLPLCCILLCEKMHLFALPRGKVVFRLDKPPHRGYILRWLQVVNLLPSMSDHCALLLSHDLAHCCFFSPSAFLSNLFTPPRPLLGPIVRSSPLTQNLELLHPVRHHEVISYEELNRVWEKISLYTTFLVYTFVSPGGRRCLTFSNSSWLAKMNSLFGSPHLDHPTYNCPCVKTLWGSSSPATSRDCPWALLMVK